MHRPSLDDGIIDPADTRTCLGLGLAGRQAWRPRFREPLGVFRM